jgi:hypothetical protein
MKIFNVKNTKTPHKTARIIRNKKAVLEYNYCY